ncbi:FAD-dependent oxidoreductase [Ginsengibacter hankyongi]|uniref:FAD-dependent oxidoreductase n=1 Tax=Ginsengibacter hankyongi TaxID=2607284 RepID=A0A5J5IKJ4_9BACT|nr:FAD-dependent oxidoreductase [Ginsengibacter hankyongi]KAA9040557.1 FAD-dependent oxidoreductase [Ginsengibacter hankyongi]
MITNAEKLFRDLKKKEIESDLVVVGGGIAGVCASIAAARLGLKVVLVNDRPVLGGNASSEVRLWVLGATSHMGNNNRWSREGGIIDELLVENMYRNPEGNAVIFDTIILDKVIQENNITLLLNTSVYHVLKKEEDRIYAVEGFCSQNQIKYTLSAPLFVDASGDGIVGFLSGAAFRMGAESTEEFGEKFAPSKEYGELLGHSLYFYTKDTGKKVKYIPPSYALKDITAIPRYRGFNTNEFGCRLWWIEYGGRLDTVHDTEKIKWELWKVVYGVWNHIKNSGEFPDAENLTLEWVGTIPGKRESRRFEGDYIIRQQDIVEQRVHADAVAFGGWSIDLHPADGVFSEKPGCNQWHSKGIYQIPLRSLYSRNVKNLFLAGRIISSTHVAFASTRVMATCGCIGQAVGTAAWLCKSKSLIPATLLVKENINNLQQALLRAGHFIPGIIHNDSFDLVAAATLTASSELHLNELRDDNLFKTLEVSFGQLIPLLPGKVPTLIVQTEAEIETKLEVQLRISRNINNYTPETILETLSFEMSPGRNCIQLNFNQLMPEKGYAFICFLKNPQVSLHFSEQRVTGILSVFNHINVAVSNYGKQSPTDDIGVEAFEFWCPKRRPEGQNLAIKIEDGLYPFSVENIRNGIGRPTTHPNAWVADYNDPSPSVTLNWSGPKRIKCIEICFDTDFDHPMESVLLGHPERVMPFCVRNYSIIDQSGNVVYKKEDNYQSLNTILFDEALVTDMLQLKCDHPSKDTPVAIFAIRCYEN